MPQETGSALFTDLYELTMGVVYHAEGMNSPATFEMFVRGLPPGRNFLVAAGFEQVLDYLEGLRFSAGDIDYLRSLGQFEDSYLDMLSRLRFTGDVWAMPEGSVFFPNEPLIRITALRIEAQLVETFVLNCINFQSMVASKAARIAIASEGRPFADFSGRRDHGYDAALLVARASYIAGAMGTSSIEAGQRFGIPLAGTMAHSYVMSFDRELDAFVAYLRAFPSRPTLLIDTYGNANGARNAVEAARQAASFGATLGAVRIDSGDFESESRVVRAILDEAGLEEVRIFVSGDLDEYAIAKLLAAGAPVDAFGVGTRMGVSADAPYLPGVYKLVEDESGGRLKLSAGKESLPGRKQVYRQFDAPGLMAGDTISLHDEPGVPGEPLLQQVMRGGARVATSPGLLDVRERCARQLEALPPGLRSLETNAPYPVSVSKGLAAMRDGMAANHR